MNCETRQVPNPSGPPPCHALKCALETSSIALKLKSYLSFDPLPSAFLPLKTQYTIIFAMPTSSSPLKALMIYIPRAKNFIST